MTRPSPSKVSGSGHSSPPRLQDCSPPAAPVLLPGSVAPALPSPGCPAPISGLHCSGLVGMEPGLVRSSDSSSHRPPRLLLAGAHLCSRLPGPRVACAFSACSCPWAGGAPGRSPWCSMFRSLRTLVPLPGAAEHHGPEVSEAQEPCQPSVWPLGFTLLSFSAGVGVEEWHIKEGQATPASD